MNARCFIHGGCDWNQIGDRIFIRPEGEFKYHRMQVFQECKYCQTPRAILVSPVDSESRYSEPDYRYSDLDRMLEHDALHADPTR